MGKELDLNELIDQAEKAKKEYIEVLNSGMFWEWYPDLTGNYERDELEWGKIYNELVEMRKYYGK